jgi:hypothetical protein
MSPADVDPFSTLVAAKTGVWQGDEFGSAAERIVIKIGSAECNKRRSNTRGRVRVRRMSLQPASNTAVIREASQLDHPRAEEFQLDNIYPDGAKKLPQSGEITLRAKPSGTKAASLKKSDHSKGKSSKRREDATHKAVALPALSSNLPKELPIIPFANIKETEKKGLSQSRHKASERTHRRESSDHSQKAITAARNRAIQLRAK